MKIVICSNNETIAQQIEIPREIDEYSRDMIGGMCDDAWFSGCRYAAIRVADDYDTDGDFRHYHGGNRAGIVEISLDVPPWHLGWGDADTDTVIGAVRAAGDAAVFRASAGEADSIADNAEADPEDWPETDPAVWRVLAASWRDRAAEIVVDFAEARAAWERLAELYRDDEADEEEENA